MTNKIIAIDAMGGDAGPAATLPATRLFLEKNQSFKVNMFGEMVSKLEASCLLMIASKEPKKYLKVIAGKFSI